MPAAAMNEVMDRFAETSATPAPARSNCASMDVDQILQVLTDVTSRLDSRHDVARSYILRASTLLLQEQKRSERSRGSGLAPWQLRKVMAHLDANLDRRIALAELAALIGLSPGYFSRAFCVSLGEPPHALFMRKRIARVQALMLETASPLSQIALECGFSDQAHLSRSFLRHVGLTPNAWRKQHQVQPAIGSPWRAPGRWELGV